MKILLIYPYWLEERIRTEDVVVVPIGVYYVAALLKENGYDTEILNWHNINETPHKIREILIEKKPDVIGFSILQANRWGGIEIARVAREINPDVKIVFGGPSPTFLWKHFLTHFPQIDFVVVGEGEYPFLNLVRCIEKADYAGIEDIDGIAFRKDGRILKTKDPEPIQNLDALPSPAKYFEYRHLYLTRGCTGKCKFCGSPLFWGPRVRSHSTEYFVEQLELLYNKGVTFFYFSDDTFTFSKKDVIEICKKILQKKLIISWVAISRVNAVSEDVICWMRKAGCIQISYGVESGSEKIRKTLNKRIKTDQIEKAFKTTGEHGILPRAYFIYGCPGESRETIRESLELIYKIKPLVVHFFILSIFPGTALYSEYKKKFKVTDDVWLERIEEIKYFETDPRLSREQVLSFGRELRSGYYAHLPGIVDGIRLIDKPELYPLHSDFCSRLGMTFDHGDYSQIDDIKNTEIIAESLYTKALEFHPSPRAYLGLGILKQKAADHTAAIEILSRGVEFFPDNMQISLCLAISHMNTGAFDRALAHLLPFQNSKETLGFIMSCYEATGDAEKAALFRKKLQSVSS
ncbi:MAG: cobalamin-dependent protein [Pseudomonadota bacterium]